MLLYIGLKMNNNVGKEEKKKLHRQRQNNKILNYIKNEIHKKNNLKREKRFKVVVFIFHITDHLTSELT